MNLPIIFVHSVDAKTHDDWSSVKIHLRYFPSFSQLPNGRWCSRLPATENASYLPSKVQTREKESAGNRFGVGERSGNLYQSWIDKMFQPMESVNFLYRRSTHRNTSRSLPRTTVSHGYPSCVCILVFVRNPFHQSTIYHHNYGMVY